jgi:hypothetical protein
VCASVHQAAAANNSVGVSASESHPDLLSVLLEDDGIVRETGS